MDMMRDQYGNKVGRKDEFGEPIQERDTSYGTHQQQQGKGAGTGHGTRTTTGPVTSGGAGTGGIGGQPQVLHPDKEEPHNGGVLRRSGSSSSSSSSEDDGMGGRRKKGLKEKIKEKLPGGRKTNEQQHGQTATGGYGTTTGQHEPVAEQKGIAEKIKEKIPGGGGNKTDQERAYGTTTGYGSTPGGTTATGPAENKGMMEKIKEKIPGGQKTEEHAHGTAGYGTTPGTAATTTGTTAATGHNEPAENKGMMGKIKEKLPGRH